MSHEDKDYWTFLQQQFQFGLSWLNSTFKVLSWSFLCNLKHMRLHITYQALGEKQVLWGEMTADKCLVHLCCPVIMMLSLCYDCLTACGEHVTSFLGTFYISLRRRLMASAEKMAPHQSGNVLVDKCLGFRCWTYWIPSPQILAGHVLNSSTCSKLHPWKAEFSTQSFMCAPQLRKSVLLC